MLKNHPEWNKLKAQSQSWLNFGVGKSGVRFSWAFHKGPEHSVELYIDTQDAEENDHIYSRLKEDAQQIEDEPGELIWQRLPDKRASRIKMARDIPDYVEDLRELERDEFIEWPVEKMGEFQRVFEPRISNL